MPIGLSNLYPYAHSLLEVYCSFPSGSILGSVLQLWIMLQLWILLSPHNLLAGPLAAHELSINVSVYLSLPQGILSIVIKFK